MESKSRLFIYDRKEMAVLLLLGVMVALFAFTLGVHLGKRVGPKTAPVAVTDPAPAETVSDQAPNRQELTEQAKNVPQAVDESLDQSLHEEVGKTGIRLDSPKPLELPKNTSPAQEPEANTQAPTAEKAPPRERLTKEAIPAAMRPAPNGKYTLQVGSHPTLEEARDQADALDALGLKPYLREVQLKQRGTWFRVFLGGYPTKEEAQQAGNRYKDNHMIDSFIVTNRTED